MKVKKSLYLTIICVLFSPILSAASSNIEEITKSITEICSQPSEAGKYWNVAVSGDGEAKIKLLLANAGITGSVNFNKGEWEGTQNTIENSKDYRECVKKLAPMFVDKFSMVSVGSQMNIKPRKLGGVSWRETHSGVSVELKNCDKKGSNITCNFILEALNTDTRVVLECRSNRCPSYDQDGNEFDPFNLSVANKSHKNRLVFTLIQGISTKMNIRYNMYKTSVAIPKISLRMNDTTFQFRNMSVNVGG